MRIKAAITLSLILTACTNSATTPFNPTPQFELLDFVVKEEKTEATEYSKAYNSFNGAGTLVAKNVSADRNLLVWVEARDRTDGADSEPHVTAVLFRGGVGKLEITKSKYGETSSRPDYQWSILGWQELNKATINTTRSQP